MSISYITTLLILLGASIFTSEAEFVRCAQNPESPQLADESTTCSLDSIFFTPLTLGNDIEHYNAEQTAVLRCIPSLSAAEITPLNGLFRLDAKKKVAVDDEVWFKVETYARPKRNGWIPASAFSTKVIKASSWTTFLLQFNASTTEYYEDEAILYELQGGQVDDSLTLPVAYPADHQFGILNDHILEGVDQLIRYESRSKGDSSHYYQDLIAYANGRLTPLVFTDNESLSSDTADVSEHIIYLPMRTVSGEVYLAPLEEGVELGSQEMRYAERYRFTSEVSVPIDQCIIRFYERSSHLGKLKKRITEVYHWNGTDIARMYGDEVEFGE